MTEIIIIVNSLNPFQTWSLDSDNSTPTSFVCFLPAKRWTLEKVISFSTFPFESNTNPFSSQFPNDVYDVCVYVSYPLPMTQSAI